MIQFFWSRNSSIWLAAIYLIAGIILLVYPDVSGTVFCWGLGIVLLLYALTHLWRFLQARRNNCSAGNEIIIGGLFAILAILCLIFPQNVLSLLPLSLGILLLLDGLGKIPMVLNVFQEKLPYPWLFLLSSLVPLILGIVLIINPFSVVTITIMFFGASLIVDGIFELISVLFSAKN